MSILDFWENDYQMFVKTPDGEVTDFKIKLDVSWNTFEKVATSEGTEDHVDVMIDKLKPIILDWENLVEDGTPVLCTDESKGKVLNIFWILEQLLTTYIAVMVQYCRIKGIEQNAQNFMKNLKEIYNIN